MNLSFPYRVDHIPRSTPNSRRPGIRLDPTTITIHSTANTRSTALNERGWLTNSSNNRTASWHIAVDDRMAVEAIPLNEVAYHAGNREGNLSSLGLEICESGNREKTIANTVELVVAVLRERRWEKEKVVRHFDWSGKICPRIMVVNNWSGWREFIERIEFELRGGSRAALPLPEVQRRLRLYYQGRLINMDGYLIESTSYVPVKVFTDQLGRRVVWDGKEYSIDIR